MATQTPSAPTPRREAGRLGPVYGLLNRRAIGDEIERLIELLDAAEGDCDLEDDDPCMDPLDAGELAHKDDDGIILLRPIYGVDQSEGPINEHEMIAAHKRAQLNRGLALREVNVSARVAELMEGGAR